MSAIAPVEKTFQANMREVDKDILNFNVHIESKNGIGHSSETRLNLQGMIRSAIGLSQKDTRHSDVIAQTQALSDAYSKHQDLAQKDGNFAVALAFVSMDDESRQAATKNLDTRNLEALKDGYKQCMRQGVEVNAPEIRYHRPHESTFGMN